MSPRGNTLQAVSIGDVLSLCERGRWREVSDLIPGIKAETEVAFARGCVLVLTRPEDAKDVLSRAIRLLPAGELKERAMLWLATAYWSTGEAREARVVLDSIEPSTVPLRFLVGLNASIFSANKLTDASRFLKGVEVHLDDVPDLYKAKFFLQRGWLKRRAGEIDAAIVDYEAARFLFEQAEAPRYLAAAINNLAGLLIDTKRFAEAHDAVDLSLKAVADDQIYLGQFYDQKASIFLAEERYVEAEEFAARSVRLLTGTEHRSVLAESLITQAKALKRLERYVDALTQLEEARGLADYLESKQLLFTVAKEEKESSQALAEKTHVEMVQTALDISGGKLRATARLVGVKPQPLSRFIRSHKMVCDRRVTKSPIPKLRKQIPRNTPKSLKKP